MQWAHQKQTGFTIVELLIVIIVIAILATITIVSYNGITNRAYDTATTSGVRTITTQVQTNLLTGAGIPGEDFIAGRTNNSGNGTVVYSFEGLTDYTDSTASGYKIVSSSSFASQYGVKVGGRAGYIAMAVPTGTVGQYYVTAMGVGMYISAASVPAAQRIMVPSDPVLPTVTGWYMLTGNGAQVRGGQVSCTNGSTPNSILGANWSAISQGLQPRVATVTLSNGRITLGSRDMSVRRATLSCPGGVSDLYVLVNNSASYASGAFGYMGAYPIEGTTEARAGN
jgi:prepilin-type N-terminal cleavage/methylation domain-containing protein